MPTYKYPRPALTTDALIFGYDSQQDKLYFLAIQRLNEPFKNLWALPGGFVDMDETVETSANRELQEETGLKNITLEQLITASKIDRDPRGRTISVVFWAITEIDYNVKGADDAKEAKWIPVSDIPKMAFDHNEIINYAIKKLKLRLQIYENFPAFFNNKIIKNNVKNIKKEL